MTLPPAAPGPESGRPREAGWNLDTSYARLPATLFSRVRPAPVRAPRILLLNRPLARELGLDPDRLAGDGGAALLSGNDPPPGADPIAQAYAGHQFGHFTMLGDGRALLLGEQLAADGKRYDIQLKGSGRTPYSRGGDGRAALGPMLREHLISEAMHALGIPTTRSLAVIATGEPVVRGTPLPGAVLVRVASSHLRVGTFEYAAATGDPALPGALVAYALARHAPERAGAANPARALLKEAVARQAALVARWMAVGFIHGVMNTDNMAVSGETIDYGPCAFMDEYDPATVFSSIDRRGRYAFGNQPAVAAWNLARFAETLLPLLSDDPARAAGAANEVLETFPDRFRARRLALLREKLGLSREEAGDEALADDFLSHLHRLRADHTNAFRALARGEAPTEAGGDPAFREWRERHRLRLAAEPCPPEAARRRMRAANPAVIPRNHQVERALAAAVEGDDLAPLERLLAALLQPFDEPATFPGLLLPPLPAERVTATFCGT